MAATAFQIQYRQEFIAGFEQSSSLLRETVTTEAVIKGNQATFLVASSGGATAVTRGVSGLIPARDDSLTQTTATLNEWHDLVRKTNFNIFASQGNQRAIMQATTMTVINRKIDDQITTLLNTGTVAIGSSVTLPSVSLVMNSMVKLQNASVPWDSNITLLCQPAFLAYMMQTEEFTSAEFVNIRPFAGDDPNWRDRPQSYKWMNMLVISHPNLPGRGTSSEINFLYHKSAIGHAANVAGMENVVGYDEEQGYSYAHYSINMGGVLLQNAGICVITADGSAYA
jgi:hypothetical protein